jgi:hypothetical protein
MKDNSLIEFSGIKYAVGLDWEGLPQNIKTKAISHEIKLLSKKKGKDIGCKIFKEDNRQIGFAKNTQKNKISLGSLVAKEITNSLFFKQIDNLSYWVCGINAEGLVMRTAEGVCDEEELRDIIDDLRNLGDINLSCSEPDGDKLFEGDEIDIVFNHITIEEIISKVKRSKDDEINELIGTSVVAKKVVTFSVSALIIGVIYTLFFQVDPLYQDIIDGDFEKQLKITEKQYKILKKEGNSKALQENFYNSGRMIVSEEFVTSIYSKEEMVEKINLLFNNFPKYLVEWELDIIEFNKEIDNSDIYFSVVYKKISDSTGFQAEIKENIEKISGKLDVRSIFNEVTNDGSVIAYKLYFKDAVELVSEVPQNEVVEDNKKTEKDNIKKIKRIKSEISKLIADTEEVGFIGKRFGGTLEDLADEVDSQSRKASKLYKELITIYTNVEKAGVEIPIEKINGSKSKIVNLEQKNYVLDWRVETSSKSIPEIPRVKKGEKSLTPFIKVWNYTLSSSSKYQSVSYGLTGLKNSVNLIKEPWININNITYKIDNESWSIKGEIYEKN